MTTPGSQARQTAADNDPVPAAGQGDGGAGGGQLPAGEVDFDYDADLPAGWPGSRNQVEAADGVAGWYPGDTTFSGFGPTSADVSSADPASAELASTALASAELLAGAAVAAEAAERAAAAPAAVDASPADTSPADTRVTGARIAGARVTGGAAAARVADTGTEETAAAAEAGAGGSRAGYSGAEGSGARGSGEGPAGTASVMRSSGIMAVGTLASRLTGFLRTLILLIAIGTKDLGNAYQIANTVPNAVYNLALGGVLTSVVVPLLVSAARRDRDHDRGEAYDQRIFTLGVLALGGITVVATAIAAPIIDIYGSGLGSASTRHLTVIFAYFFLPQIFFYGVSSLGGAILNARGRFGAPMWTPVINNVVVIGVALLFVATSGLNRTPQDISSGAVQLLAVGTTLGIVLQTAALIPWLRRAGFRWRPRFDFRKSEVSEIGRMGGWMVGYVLTTQASFLVTARVANRAGSEVARQAAAAHLHAAGAGFAAYSNAWQLFQLPYAIVGISVITAMLPRMSAHADARQYRLVSADFSTATRLASVIVVPAAFVLAVLGAPLAEAIFGHGSTSLHSANYLGVIFAVFSLGLLPYMLFQLQLRLFYSMHDSRTPALIGVVTMAVNIVANYVALDVLPARQVVAGLGVGFGLANLLGSVIAWIVLSRRIGGLDGRAVASSLIRMHAATIAPVLFALAVSVTVDVVLPSGDLNSLITVTVAGCGGLLLYVMFARAFRVSELADLTESVTGRFRR